ncbi:MAG: winged helix-turn-helix transcriptional regulator [Clostridia bacterium]|nr:winged helix-turn-helix transcriptional regulator [Clostridia bacterium]
MKCQIAIYSGDAVFARMLELEFLTRNMSVITLKHPNREVFSEVALLDLDSAAAPDAASYGRMIGFTRGAALADDGTRRLCSMILHRPFEMRLLRREVLGEVDGTALLSAEAPARQTRLLLDAKRSVLSIDGQKIALTPRESAVIGCLLKNRGTPVSRQALSVCIGESSANKTDVYICYLRRKLETVCPQRLIQTVRGKGYMIP